MHNVAWDGFFWSDVRDEIAVFDRDAVFVQNDRCNLNYFAVATAATGCLQVKNNT
jgi:hypothetical protein